MAKKSILKNLGMTSHDLDIKSIADALEEGYLSYNDSREREKRSFAPSQIGYGHGRCARYWWYAFSGTMFEQDNDATGIANMKNGIAAHERLGEALSRSSLDIEEIEKKIENANPPIFGFIDLVANVDTVEGKKRVVGEIKTARYESFQHRQANMKPPGYHILQILIYMELEGTEYGFLLYENKNDHTILIVPIALKDYEAEVEETFEWMRLVRGAFDEGRKPSRVFKDNARICSGCPVRETCFSEPKEGEVEIGPLRVLR